MSNFIGQYCKTSKKYFLYNVNPISAEEKGCTKEVVQKGPTSTPAKEVRAGEEGAGFKSANAGQGRSQEEGGDGAEGLEVVGGREKG